VNLSSKSQEKKKGPNYVSVGETSEKGKSGVRTFRSFQRGEGGVKTKIANKKRTKDPAPRPTRARKVCSGV